LKENGLGARGRIIYLTQLFSPEPTFKGVKFVKGLEAQGFAVEVVTGFPNYPGGKIYEGYRVRPIQREVMDGVSVTRLAMYPSHGQNSVKRMLCYFSFMASSLFYLLFRAPKADLILVYHPSIIAGLSALIARIFRGTPVIVDIQDIWPDSFGSTGMINSKRALRLIEKLCQVVYRGADHITVITQGARDLLMSRGVPSEKIRLIYEFAEETALPLGSPPPEILAKIPGFRVLFAGNMGAAQGLSTVLSAAELVAKQRAEVQICLLGAGIELEALKAKALEMGLTNVHFLPRVPLADVQSYLIHADCLLVNLIADPLFKTTIPSKLLAYLYAGRPILMSVEGESARLVAEAGAGLSCPPQNPAALADAICKMYDMGPIKLAQMGEKGKQFYSSNLSFAHNINGHCALIDSIKRPFQCPGSRHA
jgi:colanic acid biosynthesis glycosyl transferase WcaI